jgi:hypothetical protein
MKGSHGNIEDLGIALVQSNVPADVVHELEISKQEKLNASVDHPTSIYINPQDAGFDVHALNSGETTSNEYFSKASTIDGGRSDQLDQQPRTLGARETICAFDFVSFKPNYLHECIGLRSKPSLKDSKAPIVIETGFSR